MLRRPLPDSIVRRGPTETRGSLRGRHFGRSSSAAAATFGAPRPAAQGGGPLSFRSGISEGGGKERRAGTVQRGYRRRVQAEFTPFGRDPAGRPFIVQHPEARSRRDWFVLRLPRIHMCDNLYNKHEFLNSPVPPGTRLPGPCLGLSATPCARRRLSIVELAAGRASTLPLSADVPSLRPAQSH